MALGSESARTRIETALAEAVRNGVTPGAAVACARFSEGGWHVLQVAVGQIEPGGTQVQVDTPYDLASVTKPFVAMTALSLAGQGALDLACPVSEYLPELVGTHGGAQSLALLLSHRAGLSPWGSLFQAPVTGSSEMRAFMLREAATRRDSEERPAGSVYSDLGYLLAGEAIARAAGLPLERLVERELTMPLGCADRVFYAAALDASRLQELRTRVAVTEYCAWRKRLIRGEVHDENCAAFGGIAGHAGLFGDADGVLRLGMGILDVMGGRSALLDREHLRWALTPRAGGGHVIGWDTKSETGSSAGQAFSPRSFGHLGFTGTSLWCDPARDLCAVLLTNRVHPTRENVLIRSFRPRFHDLVIDAIG